MLELKQKLVVCVLGFSVWVYSKRLGEIICLGGYMHPTLMLCIHNVGIFCYFSSFGNWLASLRFS